MTWKFHIEKSTNVRYDMILGRDLLTALGLDIKFYDNVIVGGEGPYEGCSSPIFYVSNYNFKSISDKTVKPEECFINSYADECLKSENAKSSTRRIHRILDVKYEKSDLKYIMTEQCQHLTAT